MFRTTAIKRLAERSFPHLKTDTIGRVKPPGLKKVWPPDFTKLSHSQQLRLEKRFKRRLALAMTNPTWDKGVRLAQMFTITFVFIYSVLFMDIDGNQLDPFRNWFFGQFNFPSEEDRFNTTGGNETFASPSAK